ncbi:MAG: MBL fold metallo-hydrolase [Proteobacteria bacterium]|nr:MBL fold metallo-hydrolase [Pseudomonadota bacterium]
MFIEQRQVGQMAVFAYLVGDENSGEALIIDPAAETEAIIAAAEKKKVKIKYIVNTHGHVDHIGGNVDMKKATGAAIVIHEDDAEMLVATPATMLRMFGAKQSPPADRTVRDGDLIEVGTITLQVIHTPGHSPGSIVLHTDGYAFTGDTLFVEAVGRTDLPGGSEVVMYDSIQRKLCTLPDETVVLPGHNYGSTPTSTIGHEKKFNPFLR